MVVRREEKGTKFSSNKKGGASLNEEDYFSKLNEEAIKKVLGEGGEEKEKEKE